MISECILIVISGLIGPLLIGHFLNFTLGISWPWYENCARDLLLTSYVIKIMHEWGVFLIYELLYGLSWVKTQILRLCNSIIITVVLMVKISHVIMLMRLKIFHWPATKHIALTYNFSMLKLQIYSLDASCQRLCIGMISLLSDQYHGLRLAWLLIQGMDFSFLE